MFGVWTLYWKVADLRTDSGSQITTDCGRGSLVAVCGQTRTENYRIRTPLVVGLPNRTGNLQRSPDLQLYFSGLLLKGGKGKRRWREERKWSTEGERRGGKGVRERRREGEGKRFAVPNQCQTASYAPVGLLTGNLEVLSATWHGYWSAVADVTSLDGVLRVGTCSRQQITTGLWTASRRSCTRCRTEARSSSVAKQVSRTVPASSYVCFYSSLVSPCSKIRISLRRYSLLIEFLSSRLYKFIVSVGLRVVMRP